MVLADKYRYFQLKVREAKMNDGVSLDRVVYLTKNNMEKTSEGRILDDMHLTRPCCRRHMLTHVDIE
jgi:DNA-directed RNA polymerase I, II, and III subunit RPABC5